MSAMCRPSARGRASWGCRPGRSSTFIACGGEPTVWAWRYFPLRGFWAAMSAFNFALEPNYARTLLLAMLSSLPCLEAVWRS